MSYETEPAYPRKASADAATENPLRAALGERGLEQLIAEIRRYLAVVEFFRGEGCEPRWT